MFGTFETDKRKRTERFRARTCAFNNNVRVYWKGARRPNMRECMRSTRGSTSPAFGTLRDRFVSTGNAETPTINTILFANTAAVGWREV